jgi:hypothetical protein
MGLMRRLQVLLGVTIANASAGIVYATAGQQLLARAGTGGTNAGFLSGTVDQLDVVVPLVLGIFQLGIILWFMVSSVEEERAVRGRAR